MQCPICRTRWRTLIDEEQDNACPNGCRSAEYIGAWPDEESTVELSLSSDDDRGSACIAMLSGIAELGDVAKRKHYYCDDSYYSCPKAEDGWSNELLDQNECSCGADEHNQKVEEVLVRLRDLAGDLDVMRRP